MLDTLTAPIQWLKRAWEHLASHWRPPPAPTEPAPTPRKRRAAPATPEAMGEYYFRDTILDQLDKYFLILRRLKKADRDAWDFFSTVGATLLPMGTQYSRGQLSARWLETRPAVGGIVWCGKGWESIEFQRHKIVPRMMYFSKFKRGALDVEPSAKGAALYLFTVYWDDPDDPKMKPLPVTVGIEISPTGDVRALRSRMPQAPTDSKRRGDRRFRIPSRHYAFEGIFAHMAAEHDEAVGAYLAGLFILAADAWSNAVDGSMTRVAVSRDGLTAAFGVNIERTPYFFKDRDLRTNQRKKIFHIVRTHERDLGDNRTVSVRTHFRGERAFAWNGYDVLISVPGYHHKTLSEFDAKSETFDEGEKPKGYVTTGKMAAVLGEHVRGDMRRKVASR